MVCRNLSAFADAPRAGSAEAKLTQDKIANLQADAPRAGSAEAKGNEGLWAVIILGCTPCRQRRGKATPRRSCCPTPRDAPRAGSAEQNNNVPPDGPLTTGRHFFTFHPSRIPTLLPSSSVTMYNPVPIFLTDPAWRSRISPTVPMLSVTGRPHGYAWYGESLWV